MENVPKCTINYLSQIIDKAIQWFTSTSPPETHCAIGLDRLVKKIESWHDGESIIWHYYWQETALQTIWNGAKSIVLKARCFNWNNFTPILENI